MGRSTALGRKAAVVVSRSKTKKATCGEISIQEAVAWINWTEDGILAACESGNFPPAVRHGDGWIISVKRLERWLGEDEYKAS
jgi:hypothetical protein